MNSDEGVSIGTPSFCLYNFISLGDNFISLGDIFISLGDIFISLRVIPVTLGDIFVNPILRFAKCHINECLIPY